MSAGHVSGTLDALADRLLCWLVTPREFSYVLAGPSLSPCSPCAARQIFKLERPRSERPGEARLRSLVSLTTMERQFFGMSKSRRELAVLT